MMSINFIIQCGTRKIESAPDQIERAYRAYIGGRCAACEGKCEWDHFLCKACRNG
jgi:hypothetical protein